MIKINDNYYITADKHTYILQKKSINQNKTSENYGKETYKDVGYYSNLESLLNGILKSELRSYISKSEINSIIDLKKEIIKLNEFINSLNLNI